MISIHDFVRDALAHGEKRESIKSALQKAGWQPDEIKNALDAYADIPFSVPVPKRKPYVSAQEAFMYLVLFLTLYISAISLGGLLFQLINHWLPDMLIDGGSYGYRDAIRQATASLIIAYPVFILMTWGLWKGVKKDPEKRGSKIRKWLIYITLFIAAGVIIGDLIALVANLLNGDLTLRFALKVLTVGGIAGTIFGYYLWDARRDDKSRTSATSKRFLILPMAVTAAMLASIITGLTLSGSPATERSRRFDQERLSDLEQLRFSVIDSFYQQNGRLPSSLEEARASSPMGPDVFLDPQTQELYEYTPLSNTDRYTLCAVFDLPSGAQEVKSNPVWEHEAGHVCFGVAATKSPSQVKPMMAP